jgi:hypothetical protein
MADEIQDDVKATGPIVGTVGGAWAVFELVKKYGPWVTKMLPWVVVTILFILGKSQTPPGAPPVLPQGHYVSDGVTVKAVGPAEVVPVATAGAK